MKIFLIEDSKSICARIRASTESIPATIVGEVSSQSEAIAKLENANPDVAVIDLRLRSGNGLAVLRHIKKVLPNTITIVLTNHGLDEFAKPCLQAGADYYLEKTRQYQDFVALLKTLSDAKKLL